MSSSDTTADEPLRIVDVEAIPLAIPYTHPGATTGFGGRTWTTIDLLLVKLTTASGVVGWGEAFGYNVIPATRATLMEVVRPLVIGRDAADVRALLDGLSRDLHLFGRGGVTRYALSGLEIACWDALGKHLDAPIHQLLGAVNRPARAYASLVRYGDADVVRRATREALDRGYRMVKLHEVVPEIILAAREAGGEDFELTCDVNCAWSPREAVDVLRQVRDARLLWIEEPVWPPEDLAGLAEVRRLVPDVRVAAGENAGTVWDLDQAARRGAVDVVQPSVIKIGGIGATFEALQAARAAGVDAALHSPFFGPGLLAALHLSTLQPGIWVEWLYCDLQAPLFERSVEPVDGWFTVPDGPGLGLDPLESTIAEYRTDTS